MAIQKKCPHCSWPLSPFTIICPNCKLQTNPEARGAGLILRLLVEIIRRPLLLIAIAGIIIAINIFDFLLNLSKYSLIISFLKKFCIFFFNENKI